LLSLAALLRREFQAMDTLIRELKIVFD